MEPVQVGPTTLYPSTRTLFSPHSALSCLALFGPEDRFEKPKTHSKAHTNGRCRRFGSDAEVSTEDYEAWHKIGVKDGAEVGNNRGDANLPLLLRSILKDRFPPPLTDDQTHSIFPVTEPDSVSMARPVHGPAYLDRWLADVSNHIASRQQFLVPLRFHVTSALNAWPMGLDHNLAYDAAHVAAAVTVDLQCMRFSFGLKHTAVHPMTGRTVTIQTFRCNPRWGQTSGPPCPRYDNVELVTEDGESPWYGKLLGTFQYTHNYTASAAYPCAVSQPPRRRGRNLFKEDSLFQAKQLWL